MKYLIKYLKCLVLERKKYTHINNDNILNHILITLFFSLNKPRGNFVLHLKPIKAMCA